MLVRGVCSGAGHGCCPVKVRLDKGARWLQSHAHGAFPSPRSYQGAMVSVVCGGADLLQPAQGWDPCAELCMRRAMRTWQLKLWEAGRALLKRPKKAAFTRNLAF